MTSKAEYLKRYMSGDDVEKKKKKRKIPKTNSKLARSRIVDDDIDIKALSTGDLGNTLEEDVGDNDPTIAGVIDERPEHIQQLEAYRQQGKWKVISQEEIDERLGHVGFKARHDSDSDESPPRKQRHDSDSDQSPPRKQRHDSDSDQSPPRKQRHNSDSDQSPPRKQRHDSDSDQSPPRKQRHDSDSDQSPPRKQRHDSDSDQSPPRKHKQNLNVHKSTHGKKRRTSDSDESPPRRRRRNSDSDQSPPRKQSKAKPDQSPPRRHKRDSDSDQSPPRRHKKDSDSDQSPPRRQTKDKMEQTLSGKKAGLSSAKDMKREAEILKEREDKAFKEIGDDVSGKNAKTVFRKSGKHARKQEEITPEELARREKQAVQYKVWGKGLKQQELQEATVEDTLHEMSKPMARYKDDDDLNSMLRDQHRAEDPMAAFIKKKKTGSTGKAKAKPVYSGPAPPPNRYNIMPGYRWDGVDRSNGFEKSIFAKISNRKAVAAMAYEWSVQDM